MYSLILLSIIPAFIWLLKESDWLRINLAYIPENIVRKSWADLKPLADSIPNSQKPFWLKFPENMSPLCGQEWLENTMHVVPDYKIQIKAYNVTHTITLKQADSKILKDIAIATLKPSKLERAELTLVKRQAKQAITDIERQYRKTARVSRELVRV